MPPGTDLRQLAEAVRGRSGGLVVSDRRAPRGARPWTAATSIGSALPDVHGHYPVGSGDSFLGGLLTELDRGATLVDGLRTATAAGAANALVPGSGPLRRGPRWTS